MPETPHGPEDVPSAAGAAQMGSEGVSQTDEGDGKQQDGHAGQDQEDAPPGGEVEELASGDRSDDGAAPITNRRIE